MTAIEIVVISILVLFSFFFIYPFIKSHMARGKKIAELSGVVPDDLLQKERYLLYLWAPSCGMCRGMSPIIDSMIETRDDVAKIDVAKFTDEAKALGVMGTPALIVVEKGVIANVALGAKSEKAIVKFFDG